MYHRRILSSACRLETIKRETKPAGMECRCSGLVAGGDKRILMANDVEGEVTELEVGD